jgi:hypothetical protein
VHFSSLELGYPQDQGLGQADETRREALTTLTFGAASAHALGFKNGGLRALESTVNTCTHSDIKYPRACSSSSFDQ